MKKMRGILFALGIFLWLMVSSGFCLETPEVEVRGGPITGRFFIKLGGGYNSNITLTEDSEVEKKSGWFTYITPFGEALLPFGELHELRIDASLRGIKYIEHEEMDAIEPNVGAMLDFNFNRLSLSLYERYRRISEPTERFDLDPGERFQLSKSCITNINSSGVIMRKDMGKLDGKISFSQTSFDYNEDFKSLKRIVDTYSTKFLFNVSPRATPFINCSYSTIDYSSATHNNSDEWKTSVGGRWRITPLLIAETGIGYGERNYKSGGDFAGILYSAGLNHQFNPSTTQSIEISKTVEESYGAGNYYNLYHYAYNLSRTFSPTFVLSLGTSYEYAREEGKTTGETASAVRWTPNIKFSYLLTKSLTLNFGFRNISDVSTTGENFSQNEINFGLNYRF